MEKKGKIAVIGGGGRTGKFLVDQLLAKGFQLKLLLREPANVPQVSANSNSEIIKGDVLDYEQVRSLVKDCRAVISTVGQRKDEPLVASQATRNILSAIEEADPSRSVRYILVAGINVDTPFDRKGTETVLATKWMQENFPLIHEDRQEAYRVLANSDVPWTLVRVPCIEFEGKKGRVEASLEDAPGQKISATDIASFLVSQLDDPAFVRQAPFIANVP